MSDQIEHSVGAASSRARWFLSGFAAAVVLIFAGLYLGGCFNPAIADEPGSTIIEAQ